MKKFKKNESQKQGAQPEVRDNSFMTLQSDEQHDEDSSAKLGQSENNIVSAEIDVQNACDKSDGGDNKDRKNCCCCNKINGASILNGAKKLGKRWFIDAFTGMAQGLFVTLIAGLIVKQIGLLIGDNATGRILVLAGNIASMLTGAGIGAGIASHLKAPRLVVFGAMVAGMIGAFAPEFTGGAFMTSGVMKIGAPGNPIGAYICALISCELGMLVAGRTKLDILVVPLVVIIGAVLASFVSLPAIWLVNLIGTGIKAATEIQPFIMGIVIAVSVGVLLTMPTSSAAICISLGIGGVAGGAAVVGCAAQMVGFAVMSYKENKFSGLISQGLGTSMLQIPNIMKNPKLLIPPIVASAIVGPLATTVFKLQCSPAGSGMGTSGFVGLIATIEASAKIIPVWQLVMGIILLFFVIPAVVCWAMSVWFRKMEWIKKGDLSLNYDN